MAQWPPEEWFLDQQQGAGMDPFADPTAGLITPGAAMPSQPPNLPPPLDPSLAGLPPQGAFPAPAEDPFAQQPIGPAPVPVGAPGMANAAPPVPGTPGLGRGQVMQGLAQATGEAQPDPAAEQGQQADPNALARRNGESPEQWLERSSFELAKVRGDRMADQSTIDQDYAQRVLDAQEQRKAAFGNAQRNLLAAESRQRYAQKLNEELEAAKVDPNGGVGRSTAAKVGAGIAGAMAAYLDLKFGGNRLDSFTKTIDSAMRRGMEAQMEGLRQKSFARNAALDASQKDINIANAWEDDANDMSVALMTQAEFLRKSAMAVSTGKYGPAEQSAMAAQRLAEMADERQQLADRLQSNKDEIALRSSLRPPPRDRAGGGGRGAAKSSKPLTPAQQEAQNKLDEKVPYSLEKGKGESSWTSGLNNSERQKYKSTIEPMAGLIVPRWTATSEPAVKTLRKLVGRGYLGRKAGAVMSDADIKAAQNAVMEIMTNTASSRHGTLTIGEAKMLKDDGGLVNPADWKITNADLDRLENQIRDRVGKEVRSVSNTSSGFDWNYWSTGNKTAADAKEPEKKEPVKGDLTAEEVEGFKL